MANRSKRIADSRRVQLGSDAVSRIRCRRATEDPDVLLDEALAALERVLGTTDGSGNVRSDASGPMARRHLYVARSADDPFPEIDGDSPAIRKLKQHMRRVAVDAEVTVLISGESGTGKERVARAIHRASPRHRAPFVVVNCAGLSPTLIEDELFGHVRGAFTGAIDDRPGPFERANGGTVFLDEIGDLTLDLQMKLLRALQQRTVQRLGSRHETPFEVRVIAATNVDLALAKARGRFRDDLYYRLKVYELKCPALRSRGRPDIRILADAILQRLAERRCRPSPLLAGDVLERLCGYPWPGNVRELENTLECMIVAAGGAAILTLDHLPEGFGVSAPGESSARTSSGPLPSAPDIEAALERNGFSCNRAAAELGVSRHQLYRLRTRYGPGSRERSRRGLDPAGDE